MKSFEVDLLKVRNFDTRAEMGKAAAAAAAECLRGLLAENV